jgi:hypothetical protein
MHATFHYISFQAINDYAVTENFRLKHQIQYNKIKIQEAG